MRQRDGKEGGEDRGRETAREQEGEGELLYEQGSDRCSCKQSKGKANRGAIVLRLSHPFLLRTVEGGGAGRQANR